LKNTIDRISDKNLRTVIIKLPVSELVRPTHTHTHTHTQIRNRNHKRQFLTYW